MIYIEMIKRKFAILTKNIWSDFEHILKNWNESFKLFRVASKELPI